MPSIPDDLAGKLSLREKEALRRLSRNRGEISLPDPFLLSSLIRLRLVDADHGSCLPTVTPLGRDVLLSLDRAARTINRR